MSKPINLDTIRADLVPVADLEFGKTPWDKLDRDQMIYLLQSYHSVAKSIHGVVRNLDSYIKAYLPGYSQEYFQDLETAANYVYSGWNAEAQAFAYKQGIKVAYGSAETPRYPEESDQMWRCMERPSVGVLAFDHPDRPWSVCERCKTMLAPAPTADRPFNCKKGSASSPCHDQFRPYTWDDFRNPPAEEEVS